MDKEIAGQPLWLWLTGAGVVILGYLYFRSHAAPSSGAGGSSGQGGGKETSSSSIKEWITQHDGPPSKPPPSPPPKKGPGPEREWLIHKTGSDRPWTFLAQHHERVEVGPTGSRKIVGA